MVGDGAAGRRCRTCDLAIPRSGSLCLWLSPNPVLQLQNKMLDFVAPLDINVMPPQVHRPALWLSAQGADIPAFFFCRCRARLKLRPSSILLFRLSIPTCENISETDTEVSPNTTKNKTAKPQTTTNKRADIPAQPIHRLPLRRDHSNTFDELLLRR